MALVKFQLVGIIIHGHIDAFLAGPFDHLNGCSA